MHEHELVKNAVAKGQVLMLCASCDTPHSDEDLNAWLAEIAVLYYKLRSAGYDVTMASLKGGCSPLARAGEGGVVTAVGTEEAATTAGQAAPPELVAFLKSHAAVQQLQHTVPLHAVLAETEPSAEDVYCAVVLPGGPDGVTAALASDPGVASLVSRMYAAGRVVAAVGHGLAGLVGAELPATAGGGPLVAGQRVAMPEVPNPAAEAAGATPAGGGTPMQQLARRLLALGALPQLGADGVAVDERSTPLGGCLVTGRAGCCAGGVGDAMVAALKRMQGPPSPGSLMGKEVLQGLGPAVKAQQAQAQRPSRATA